jgi:AP-3 complex subunit delta-1
MDPAEFASLLSEKSHEFEHSGNVTIELSLDEQPVEEALIKALENVTSVSGLKVVEVVPGAASLYGKTAKGDAQIAGLLKYSLEMENRKATLSIDLKSTDDEILDGLLEALETNVKGTC